MARIDRSTPLRTSPARGSERQRNFALFPFNAPEKAQATDTMRDYAFTIEQRAAIESQIDFDHDLTDKKPQHQAITSCAGGGKTTVVAERVKWLIDHGVRPERIFAVTFTRAGGHALREKIGRDIGHTGTLHALAMRVLQIDPSELLTDEEAQEIARDTMRDLRIDRKITMKDAEAALQDPNDPLGDLGLFVRTYEARCADAGKITHDLVLRKFLTWLKQDPHGGARIDVLIVDEAQDTSAMDAAIYAAMAPAKLCIAVGDARQAIYQFRGASAAWLRRIERRAKTDGLHTPLTKTHRCTRIITAIAGELGDNGMETSSPNIGYLGYRSHDNQRSEEDTIMALATEYAAEGHSVAVFARYNADVERLRQAFRTKDISIERRMGARDSGDAETRDALLAIARIIAMPYIFVESQRAELTEQLAQLSQAQQTRIQRRWGTPAAIQDALTRTNPRNFLEQLAIFCPTEEQTTHEAAQGEIKAIEVIRRLTGESIEQIDDTKGIHVDTIHAAKGREFDTVILTGADTRLDGETEEEQNLLYVAATRAKNALIFTGARVILDPWRNTRIQVKASAQIETAIQNARNAIDESAEL